MSRIPAFECTPHIWCMDSIGKIDMIVLRTAIVTLRDMNCATFQLKFVVIALKQSDDVSESDESDESEASILSYGESVDPIYHSTSWDTEDLRNVEEHVLIKWTN